MTTSSKSTPGVEKAENAMKAEDSENVSLNSEAGPDIKIVIESANTADERQQENVNDVLAALETNINETDVLPSNGYPVLELRHLSLHSSRKNAAEYLIEDVNLAFRLRKTYHVKADSFDQLSAIMGLLSGFIKPSDGSILFRGTDIREIEATDYRGYRIGAVFAHDALRSDLSAIDNIVYTMEASGRNFLKSKKILARELLSEMGFPERLEDRPTAELNRMNYVRASLARAICCECNLMLLQEIMDGLSEDEQQSVATLLAKTAKRHDCAAIVCSLEEAPEEAYDAVFTLSKD